MAGAHLTYDLADGFIGNWLTAGPVVELAPGSPTTWDQRIGIEGRPVERGPLDCGQFLAGNHTGAWTYLACPEDHAIDHSATYAKKALVRAWAYAEIASDATRLVTLTITSDARFGVWVNDAPVLQDEAGSSRCHLELPAGVSRLMIRTEQVAMGATPHATTVAIEPPHGLRVQLPTLIADLGRRNAFETLSARVYLDRDVYAGDTPIILRWPDGERAFCPAHIRLHGPDESIYAISDKAGQPGDSVELGYALQFPTGPMHVTLMPSPDEVYVQHLRISHRLPFHSMGSRRYVANARGDLTERRREALLAIAQMSESPLAQIARMALAAWSDVDSTRLIDSLQDPTSHLLLAHIGMLSRYGTAAPFPTEVRLALEHAVLTFSEWDNTLVSAAAELLAGQQWPERSWADGRTGASHRAEAEAQLLRWMHTFGQFGSARPGSMLDLHDAIAAFSDLAELAGEGQVYELAAVSADKVLFMLALHSRHGAFGAASRHCPASFVKSGYLQPTAGVSRLLWGSGIDNDHALAPVSLACNAVYEPPPVLESIAHDDVTSTWSEERHAPPDDEPTEIVAYRTPDYILSSLRGVTPGRPGRSELMWRATLGPEAMVFANQPASSSENVARMPGYWTGNLRLPHVLQWQDVVFAMHRLSNQDVLGFTHAYFPLATFDEFLREEQWIFGCVGEAFIALTNTAGMMLIREGRNALRELRAFGSEQTWIVQMGRAALDGSFADFQAAVRATRIERSTGRLTYWGIRGHAFAFEWGGPLFVDGTPRPSHTTKHFDTPYASAELPSEAIDIRHRGEYLRLDFSDG